MHAARQLGDRPGQAGALTDLADARYATTDYPGAERELEEALGIYQNLDDRPGQANALTILGNTRGTIPARSGSWRGRRSSAATSVTESWRLVSFRPSDN